jgi:hypothetical protein
MRFRFEAVAVLALFLLTSGCKEGQRASLEAQQRCSDAAKRYYSDFVSSDFFSTSRDAIYGQNYTNHFNSKQDRCYVLVEWKMDPRNTGHITEFWSLRDVMENKQVANFNESFDTNLGGDAIGTGAGVVMGTLCSSREECEKLIRPLMHD